jgi:hypothetical protein
MAWIGGKKATLFDFEQVGVEFECNVRRRNAAAGKTFAAMKPPDKLPSMPPEAETNWNTVGSYFICCGRSFSFSLDKD